MKKKACEESVGKEGYVGQEEKKKLINRSTPQNRATGSSGPPEAEDCWSGVGQDWPHTDQRGSRGPVKDTHNTYQEARL